MPELLQEQCQPAKITQELFKLLDNKEVRAEQLRGFREALIRIGLGDPETPSQKAAKAVLSVIENKTASSKTGDAA